MCVPAKYAWPGLAHLVRRAVERVQHHQIEPLAGRLIEHRLQIARVFLPLRADRRERLGHHDPLAVDVGRRGGLLGEEPLVVANPMRWRAGPEFAHRNVVAAQAHQGVDRRGVRAARLRMNSQAELDGHTRGMWRICRRRSDRRASAGSHSEIGSRSSRSSTT